MTILSEYLDQTGSQSFIEVEAQEDILENEFIGTNYLGKAVRIPLVSGTWNTGLTASQCYTLERVDDTTCAISNWDGATTYNLVVVKDTYQDENGDISYTVNSSALGTPGGTVTIAKHNHMCGVSDGTGRNKIVMAGHASFTGSYYVRVRCATISGTTATFGTSVDILDNAVGNSAPTVTALDTDKFLLVYNNNVNGLTPIFRVCTISGTTITLGNATNFSESVYVSAPETDLGQTVLVDTNTLVHAYKAGDPTIMRVVTISGTTPSFGASSYTVEAGTSTFKGCGKLSASKGIAIVSTGLRVFTVSGTTITFGTLLANTSYTVNGIGYGPQLGLYAVSPNKFVFYNQLYTMDIDGSNNITLNYLSGSNYYPINRDLASANYTILSVQMSGEKFAYVYPSTSASLCSYKIRSLSKVSSFLLGVAKNSVSAGQNVRVLVDGWKTNINQPVIAGNYYGFNKLLSIPNYYGNITSSQNYNCIYTPYPTAAKASLGRFES